MQNIQDLMSPQTSTFANAAYRSLLASNKEGVLGPYIIIWNDERLNMAGVALWLHRLMLHGQWTWAIVLTINAADDIAKVS